MPLPENPIHTPVSPGRAECLILQRRFPWRGDSCEGIGPATAPLRSFHDR